jgi:Family of unknown function (DUF6163)
MADRATLPRAPDMTAAKLRVGVNWLRLNTWFHRALGALWLLIGLLSWSTILGVDPTATREFGLRAATFQAVTIYYAVVDLLAAVGLWLLAPWGGVVWLIAAVSRLVLGVVFPAASPLHLITGGWLVACIVLFMALSWMSGRRRQE